MTTITEYLVQSLAWVFLAMILGGLVGRVVTPRDEDDR